MTPRKEVIGNCELWLGDAIEVLPMVGKVDAVVTDPPYGVGLTHKRHKWFTQKGSGYASIADTQEYVSDVVVRIIEYCTCNFRNTVVTPGTRCLQLYPRADDIGCIFNKAGTGRTRWGFACNNPVLFYGKDPYLSHGLGARPNSWLQPPNDYSEKIAHPCPKPIGMMLWLVERSSLFAETILDPFMGSGTTGVACVNLGRKFIGIELEEKYFDIACRRIEKAYQQPRLFHEPPPRQKQESFI